MATLDRPVTKKAGVSSLSGTRPLRSSPSSRSAMNDVHQAIDRYVGEILPVLSTQGSLRLGVPAMRRQTSAATRSNIRSSRYSALRSSLMLADEKFQIYGSNGFSA